MGPGRGIVSTAIVSGLIVLACLVAGCLDWRWWIVGLALLFNVAPVLLALQYLAALMEPRAVRVLSTQCWTLTDDSRLRVDLFRSIDPESSPEARESCILATDDFVSARTASCGLVLRLKDGAPFSILILDPGACSADFPYEAWCAFFLREIKNPEADKIVE